MIDEIITGKNTDSLFYDVRNKTMVPLSAGGPQQVPSFSPDGKIFGKMGHSERYVKGIYKNVPGEYDIGLFRSAVKYFK